MAQPAPITKLYFQDAADSGLGRVSAATRQVIHRGLVRRRIDCFALVYTLGGACRFRHAHGSPVDLATGDAFLLFPGELHAYGPPAGMEWDEVYLLFEGAVFELWQKRGLLDVTRPVYRLEPVPYWESRIMSVWQEHGSALDRVVRLQGLLAEMNRARDEQGMGDEQQKWLEKACRLLGESAADPGGAEAVAKAMGMSYQTFRKTFSRLQGCGPSRFRTEQVMQTAARRLLMETTPVKQIAHELGFCDEFHFSRRFKQCLGISPAVYRRRMDLSGTAED